MKKFDIIYEVLIESVHNGIATTDSLLYNTKEEAMEYVAGLVDDMKTMYESEKDYNVQYSFESRVLDDNHTDTIYCAEIIDTTDDYPEHTDKITIRKRNVNKNKKENFIMEKIEIYNDSNDNDLFADLKLEHNEYDDSDIWAMVRDIQKDDFNLVWKAINSCVRTETDFGALLIYGDIQTWKGTQSYSNIFRDFDEFYDFLKGKTEYDWEIYVEDDMLHINLYHHDGVNRLVVKGVSCGGYDLYMNYSYLPEFEKCTDSDIIKLVDSKYSKHIGELTLYKMGYNI